MAKKSDEEFRETLPMYADKTLFTAEDEETPIQQRMARQLMVLIGLLLLQVVLFAVLISSTINL